MECSEDDDDDRYFNRDGELSFDYIISEQRVEAISTPQGSTKVNVDRREENPPISYQDRRTSSHSALLFPDDSVCKCLRVTNTE